MSVAARRTGTKLGLRAVRRYFQGMDAPPEAIFPLFSYGTLQLPEVQRGTYGRLLEGRSDALVGYRLAPLPITDPEVVRLSGMAVHMIARRTGDPADRIPGVVFHLTAAELEATDAYEVDAYGRSEVTLESGTKAYVYVGLDGSTPVRPSSAAAATR